jgi:flavin-binding protein dodecin
MVTKRVLSIAGAAVVGGLLSLGALAQAAKVTSQIASSPNSWEEAAKNAIEEGSGPCSSGLFEVEKLDARAEGATVVEYRARIRCE